MVKSVWAFVWRAFVVVIGVVAFIWFCHWTYQELWRMEAMLGAILLATVVVLTWAWWDGSRRSSPRVAPPEPTGPFSPTPEYVERAREDFSASRVLATELWLRRYAETCPVAVMPRVADAINRAQKRVDEHPIACEALNLVGEREPLKKG